ncbi:MAG TPA: DMT family transporter [Caldithrix abyssi]|uniref:DMT family transporter n=1 Tax=Caldithrix abyssi TaxID=187145 RepID=A0A7V4U0T6_CALAY|nr:DMT family transporter [Caldithrix abyssi]
MKKRSWLLFAIITTTFWGVWGALIEIPEKAGFPATLGYSVWALTMIPPALIVLKMVNWKLEYDGRSIFLGAVIGFTGAGGQLILFQALRTGPAYLVFPFISLSPVVTILLSYFFLKERASLRGWLGIIFALVAIPLLSYQSATGNTVEGITWIILSLLVFLAWGFQAYVMKFANETMKAESIFFYMMVTGLLLIPIAVWMTDFSQPINWGFTGPWLTAMIQILNAVGALMLVFAFRYGKAMIVSPMTNALAPVITIVISLVIYQVIPHPIIITGMVLAIVSAFLMAIEEEEEGEVQGVLTD